MSRCVKPACNSTSLPDGTYEIPYFVNNGGDGSANVYFPQSEKVAEEADENQSEGWGEPSTGTLTIVIKDGKVFYEADNITFEDEDSKYFDVNNTLIEAKKVK